MLLIVHVFIVEIQDIHYHTMGLAGGTVRIEVDGVLIVVQGLLPVPLFAVGISAEIESFVLLVWGGGCQIFVKQFYGFGHISLADKLFDRIQLLHIVLNYGLLRHKDSFYLETTNMYSVKNKKKVKVESPECDEELSEYHNSRLIL